MKSKICTSIEQSKKLIELGIDVITADMYWWATSKRYYIEAMDDGDFNEREGHVPAWSEEDDKNLDALITSLNNEHFAGRLETLKSIGVDEVINWLKSLKERVQPKQQWGEEDNKWIESLIQTFEDGYLEGFNQLKSYGVISWLKSLKQRIQHL